MRFTATATATISFTQHIEADSEEEALEKAEMLELPQLCYGCEMQNGADDQWRPSMDGEPTDIKVAEG